MGTSTTAGSEASLTPAYLQEYWVSRAKVRDKPKEARKGGIAMAGTLGYA